MAIAINAFQKCWSKVKSKSGWFKVKDLSYYFLMLESLTPQTCGPPQFAYTWAAEVTELKHTLSIFTLITLHRQPPKTMPSQLQKARCLANVT